MNTMKIEGNTRDLATCSQWTRLYVNLIDMLKVCDRCSYSMF